MSESTTAAPVATTEVSTAAPVTEQQQVATPVNEPAVINNEPVTTESAEPDYSFVPKKFLRDGKPDWENLTKSYTHLEKKASEKGVLVPEDVSEYEWSGNAPVPIAEEVMTNFKSEAQKLKFSKEQYAFVMDKYAEQMSEMGFDASKSEAQLKEVWGGEVQQNLDYARKAFDEFAPSDMSIDDPVFNHPTVLRLLARMGQDMGEDTQTGVKGNTGRAPSVSRDEITKIMNEPDYYQNLDKQRLVSAWYEKNSR